jgi:hypothetical protein
MLDNFHPEEEEYWSDDYDIWKTRRIAGVTKREMFAAMAMQGFAANPSCTSNSVANARASVIWADALLAELSKPRIEEETESEL